MLVDPLDTSELAVRGLLGYTHVMVFSRALARPVLSVIGDIYHHVSVSLCHIAAGFTEATIEFAKGFAVWDLAPGHYVLDAAGGVVLDLAGKPVPLDYGIGSLDEIATAMTRRQRFVAAGSAELAQELLAALDA